MRELLCALESAQSAPAMAKAMRVILEHISFVLREGESVALLGRNGVGKTTLLTTLMGLTRLYGGTIRWRGAALAGVPTHQRARSGLGWVPQAQWHVRILDGRRAFDVGGPPRSRLRHLEFTGTRVPVVPASAGTPRQFSAINCRAANSRCWRLRVH